MRRSRAPSFAALRVSPAADASARAPCMRASCARIPDSRACVSGCEPGQPVRLAPLVLEAALDLRVSQLPGALLAGARQLAPGSMLGAGRASLRLTCPRSNAERGVSSALSRAPRDRAGVARPVRRGRSPAPCDDAKTPSTTAMRSAATASTTRTGARWRAHAPPSAPRPAGTRTRASRSPRPSSRVAHARNAARPPSPSAGASTAAGVSSR